MIGKRRGTIALVITIFGVLVAFPHSIPYFLILAYIASIFVNPALAVDLKKDPITWFFLSFPLGIVGTFYLLIEKQNRNDDLDREREIGESERKQAKEAAEKARRQAEERARRQTQESEERARRQTQESEERARRQTQESEESEERARRQAEVEAYVSSFSNSRFKRNPVSFEEWQRTEHDLSTLVRLVNTVSEGRLDSRESPNFPVKAKEVVFLEMASSLTNHDAKSNDDSGMVYMTNFRILFVGVQKTVEWPFNKMISFAVKDLKQTAVFKCTDQPVVKGVQLSKEDWFKFQFFLNVAFDMAKRPLSEVVVELSTKLDSYLLEKPS